MEASEAFEFVDRVVYESSKRKHLNDLQRDVFFCSWQGQTYEEIAERLGYAHKYISEDVGFNLWKLLTEVLKEDVTKKNFKTVIERRNSQMGRQTEDDNQRLPVVPEPLGNDDPKQENSNQEEDVSEDNRQAAVDWIALLDELSTRKNAKNWLLTYVGENQSKKTLDLLADLRHEGQRRIQSCHSYSGVGPTDL